MSVSSEAKEFEESARRQAAIRKRLEEMDAAPPAPAADAVEEWQPPRNPWQDSMGRQTRPLTRLEREAKEMAVFDRKVLAQLEEHRCLAQKEHIWNQVEEAARQKRQRKEERTGMRPLPSRNEACSLEEAQRRGLIGQGGGGSDPPLIS